MKYHDRMLAKQQQARTLHTFTAAYRYKQQREERATRSARAAEAKAQQQKHAEMMRNKNYAVRHARQFDGAIVIKHDDCLEHTVVHHRLHNLWDKPGVSLVWWPPQAADIILERLSLRDKQ